jgi:hypothetical protein
MNPPLQKLMDAHREFARQAFPGQTVEGVIRHFERELEEVYAAPKDPMEIADCLLLLIDIANRAGISAGALVECGFTKLEINRTRIWGEPDEQGVRHHIEVAK